jgi:hypothetical protein
MQRVPLRKLKAEMALKDISIRRLSQLARVPYNTCSLILTGTHVHPEYLRRIKMAIRQAPSVPYDAPSA